MNEDDHVLFTETSGSDEENNGPKPMSLDSERGVDDDDDEEDSLSPSSSSDDEQRLIILERKRRRPSSPPPLTRAKATVKINTIDADGEENSAAFDVKRVLQNKKAFVLIVEQESESEDEEEEEDEKKEEEEEFAVNAIEALRQQETPEPVAVAPVKEVVHVPEVDLDGDPSVIAPIVCVSTYSCHRLCRGFVFKPLTFFTGRHPATLDNNNDDDAPTDQRQVGSQEIDCVKVA